jgi:molybdopterin synthase sulfur carrier subunit
MPTLLMFAAAREAAGRGRDDLPGACVGEVLDEARLRYGPHFGDVVDWCQIWVNGHPADAATAVGDADEVAVVPPVSGG